MKPSTFKNHILLQLNHEVRQSHFRLTMTKQVVTKKPFHFESITVLQPLTMKQRKNSHIAVMSANPILSLGKRSVLDLSTPYSSLNTSYRKQLQAKRHARAVHGIATISDDEDDTTLYVSEHSARNVTEGREASLSTTFTFSFPPLPIGRPLAPAPSLPNFPPGETLTSKVFLFK